MNRSPESSPPRPAPARKLTKRIERAGVRTLQRLLRGLVPRPGEGRGALSPEGLRRVLVVRCDRRLGNVLLLTPLLDALRRALPAASVEVLLFKGFSDLLLGHPAVDRLWTFAPGLVVPNPFGFVRTLGALRRRRYDLAFDASHMHAFSLENALLTALTAASRRVGYDRGDAARYLTDPTPPLPPGTHETVVLHALLRRVLPSIPPLGPLGRLPGVTLTADEIREGRSRWRGWGGDGSTVGVFVGGRGPKAWPLQDWREFFEALAGRGGRAVIFAGPAERGILEGVPLPGGILCAPELPVRSFAAALAAAPALVGVDSGPIHLAAAVGTATLALFLEADPDRYGYAHHPRHRVIDARDRPLAAGEVLDALEGLLAATGSAPPRRG